jgi:hypothetical protein
MSDPLRIFISHSSDDSALASDLCNRLSQLPGIRPLVDVSGLEAGKPWRRQLHVWMARCSAGVVLLTPAVLGRPEWVLKECIILGWRLDLDPKFSLFFALAQGVTREQFDQCGFRLAQLSDTQFLPGALADLAELDALVEAVRTRLPQAPSPTPYDELTRELKSLLRMADSGGATYGDIASHLGVETPLDWGPAQLDRLAGAIAETIVQGRDQSFAIDELLDRIRAWSKENKDKLVDLLVPYWIEPDMAGELVRRAPAIPPPEPVVPGPGAVTIKGAHVSGFTAEMTVRRAYGSRLSKWRFVEAVALGSDLFEDIYRELCEHAKDRGWVSSKKPDKVVEELRKSVAPVFVPLDVLPDPETLRRLCDEFPRMLFLAPRPPNRAGPAGDELLPDPPPQREQAEYQAWQLAKNAIENG